MANFKKQSGLTLADNLRKAVLQAAIQGRLVPQMADDGLASDLLADIQAQKQRLIDEKIIKREKPLAEITDDEKPFDIPDNWIWVRLGDLSTYIQRGKSPKYSLIEKFPVISQKCVQWSGFDIKPAKFIEPDTLESYGEERILQDDDLLWNSTGLGTVGRITRYSSENHNYEKAVADSHVTIVRLLKNKVIPRYIESFISSAVIQSNIEDICNGSTKQKELATSTVKEVLIPLPPLAEQKRIVAKLDEILPQIDELATSENALNALQSAFPKQMQSALLQSAISGQLTEQLASDGKAGDLLTAIQKEKQRLIDEKIIKREKPLAEITDDEKPFDIPDNWVWVRFGQIVSYNMGKTPPRTSAEYWQDDYPWVSIADMVENGNIITTKEKVSQTAYTDIFKEKISKAGTMIMSFKLTIGRVSILDIDAFHNEAIISIYPNLDESNAEILKSYLFKILPYISNWGNSKKAIKGNTLNSDSINNMLIPLPPLAEQKRIVAKLDELLPQVQSLTK